jgi:hypothetical protein
LPGVARRQLTFFVLPKKVSKERRAHYSGLRLPALALGFAAGKRNSLRSNIFCPKPRKAKRKSGAVEGRPAPPTRFKPRLVFGRGKNRLHAISMRLSKQKCLKKRMNKA